MQVNFHWSHNEKPEMSLEKLQKISGISTIMPQYKVRWLVWWNSGDLNRVALRFLPVGVTEEKLEAWLPKACFWAEVLQSLFQLFNARAHKQYLLI